MSAVFDWDKDLRKTSLTLNLPTPQTKPIRRIAARGRLRKHNAVLAILRKS